jgi:hypothetical protein
VGVSGALVRPVYVFMFLGDNFRSFASTRTQRVTAMTSIADHRQYPAERTLAPDEHEFSHRTPPLAIIPHYNLPIADREARRHPEASVLEWRRSYAASC